MHAFSSNPYFTTDTAAALRAVEMQADAILKGTKVDGIFTSDPEINSSAKKYNEITFQEVYENKLKVMDMTAFTLCQENKLPIIVFNINKKGNLIKALEKDNVGTIVKN